MSKNLGCKNKSDDNVGTNQVDVLIPEVIQVLFALPNNTVGVVSQIVIELERRQVGVNLWF